MCTEQPIVKPGGVSRRALAGQLGCAAGFASLALWHDAPWQVYAATIGLSFLSPELTLLAVFLLALYYTFEQVKTRDTTE